MRLHSSHKLSNVERRQYDWLGGCNSYTPHYSTTSSTVIVNEHHGSTCLVSRVDSAHHLHGVGEMRTSLQETGEKQVWIAWSTIRLPEALLKMMIIMRDSTYRTCLHTPIAVCYWQEQQKEKNNTILQSKAFICISGRKYYK